MQQASGADTADTRSPTNQGHTRGGVHRGLGGEGPQGLQPFGMVAARGGTAAVEVAVMAAKQDEGQWVVGGRTTSVEWN